MKDFDHERHERQVGEEDRTFKLGGEQFVAKVGVRPEALVRFEALNQATPGGEALEIIDDLILAMLEPRDDAEGRYRALRGRDDDPITLDDLQKLAQWLVETQTGRPTGQPADSSAGLVAPGTRSTDDSSSPALAAA